MNCATWRRALRYTAIVSKIYIYFERPHIRQLVSLLLPTKRFSPVSITVKQNLLLGIKLNSRSSSVISASYFNSLERGMLEVYWEQK